MATPELRRHARIFASGAAVGFLAGAFVVAVVVWQFGNVIGTRGAHVDGAAPRAATDRWVGDPVDSDSPVLEAVVGTGGGHPAPATPVAPGTDPAVPAAPAAELEDRDLLIPVEGIDAAQLVRSFDDDRGGRKHQAIDILAPRGTPVRAIEDGRIARLFNSRAGGITIYQFDPSERFCYYYAHLDRYADGLSENDQVRRGQIIGYVGVTGNAGNTPHLHFAMYRLTAEKRWWEGAPIDPYAILR